jgi:hypothetical protein
VDGIDCVLSALHHLPALRWLRVLVPFEGSQEDAFPSLAGAVSSVPSVSTLRTLLERCPKIERLHLSVASSRAPVPYRDPDCVDSAEVERNPSARLCELRDGCQQLPRATVQFLVAGAH